LRLDDFVPGLHLLLRGTRIRQDRFDNGGANGWVKRAAAPVTLNESHTRLLSAAGLLRPSRKAAAQGEAKGFHRDQDLSQEECYESLQSTTR
jgi:hypothetical protein